MIYNQSVLLNSRLYLGFILQKYLHRILYNFLNTLATLLIVCFSSNVFIVAKLTYEKTVEWYSAIL